jgi:dihydropteroate synthase
LIASHNVMTRTVYIRPIGTATSPQSEDGNALRLAGGMVYASRFAVITREDGVTAARQLASPAEMDALLGTLPDDVQAEARQQWANLAKVHAPLTLGERIIRLDQPQIMGILNVTPDSFSDGGQFLESPNRNNPEAGQSPDAAQNHASAMLEAGAALVDVGGESTRPGAAKVWEGDEIERVRPAIAALKMMGAAITIDTRNAATMEAALDGGAHMVNDVSALRHDPRSLAVVAERGCPVILMHAPSSGDNPHEDANYSAAAFDVFDSLKALRDRAIAAGIDADKIWLDPGIGFGKSLGDNLAILNALPMFHGLGCPLLIGLSRKRMIGALSSEEDADQRLGGSILLAGLAMSAGAQILRVHDVAETVQARNVWRGSRDAALTEFSDLAD